MAKNTQMAFSQTPVYNIQMVRDRELYYHGARLTSPGQLADAFIALVGDTDREHFVVLLLNAKNQITGLNLISIGSLTGTVVHPRETFKAAILANASRIALAHNHPSGDCIPSEEDKAITNQLKEAGDILGIQVIDHVIVNTESGDFFSFMERGLI